MPNTTLITTPEAIRFIATRNAMLKAKADYDAICKETPVAFQNEVLDAVNAIECLLAQRRLKSELLASQGESANRLFPHNL